MNKTPAKYLSPLLRLHQLDVVIFHWTMKRKYLLFLTRIARLVSHSADGFAYPLLALLLYLHNPNRGSAFAAAMALAFCLERPVYWILKNTLKRRRPASAIPDFQSFITPSDQFSFPSGHTSGAFITAILLCIFFPLLSIPALLWASLVGASRVTLGVHFPSDILAGASMGTSIGWLSVQLLASGGV